VSWVYLEPWAVALLEFVPGVSLLALLLKAKLLQAESTWHLRVYEKTFAHLQEFDLLDLLWRYSSSSLIRLLEHGLRLASHFYRRLSMHQLDYLEGVYQDALEEVQRNKSHLTVKTSLRKSRIVNNPFSSGWTTPSREQGKGDKEKEGKGSEKGDKEKEGKTPKKND
jgi:hypothetical protein